MSEAQTFVMAHPTARRLAEQAVRAAPEGFVVVVRPPTRSLEQNAKLHAALTDIAAQVEWHGRKLDVDTWKRLCTAAWLREKNEQPELIPALDGKGFDIVFQRTSKLGVKDMTELLEWVHFFGAENGVTFKGDA